MDRALWFLCGSSSSASEPYSRRGCGFNSRRRPKADLSRQNFSWGFELAAGGRGRSERRALPCPAARDSTDLVSRRGAARARKQPRPSEAADNGPPLRGGKSAERPETPAIFSRRGCLQMLSL